MLLTDRSPIATLEIGANDGLETIGCVTVRWMIVRLNLLVKLLENPNEQTKKGKLTLKKRLHQILNSTFATM